MAQQIETLLTPVQAAGILQVKPARLQMEGRKAGHAIYEVLPVAQGFGLSCLPSPSPGDIFLDLEGDPFVGEGGLEYLFGYAFRNEDGAQAYTADWAFLRTDEKQVFDRFIDFVTERLQRYPDLHIYHYAPYEPAALKRLMGRYATREEEIDRMLRSKLFVDLYAVVRHGMRASVESYSIKKLEPLYEYGRETVLSDANAALAKVQACLELGDLASIDGQGRQIVQGYNRDDCLSTWLLREWLEDLRSGLIEQGDAIERPIPQTGDPGEDLSEWQKKIDDLILRLTADVPVDVVGRNAEQQFTTDNAKLLAAVGTSCQVAAGTAWLWARQDAFESVDVLFVDEAAQMSLANVLAISQAAKSIVLLGDPQQLDQPTQGSHPEGTDVSALDHILGGQQTLTVGRGLFLEETWRLHPDICAFTSELFYENRLRPRPGLEVQKVRSTGRINGTGLRFLPVTHEGNQSSSPEEADQVRDLVSDILSSGASWVDRMGVERAVTFEDILIIAPYNAQVFELQERLPGARVGTVDKFQGQEAPIVIYSMTTSSHADAPHGMEFLYSQNQLNVATSRAKCVCVLVGSPSVFEAECRTPRHMQLANAFCRYLELAAVI